MLSRFAFELLNFPLYSIIVLVTNTHWRARCPCTDHRVLRGSVPRAVPRDTPKTEASSLIKRARPLRVWSGV